MKLLVPIILAFLSTCQMLWANEPIVVPSSVESVKVYRQGAAISRTASFTLPAGPVEIHFPALSPFLEDNSVQVQVTKGFTILSVTSTREFLTDLPMPAAYITLQDQVEKLEQLIKKDKAALEVLQEEETLLLANRQISSQQHGVTAVHLEQVSTYFRNRLTAIKLEKITVNDRLASQSKQVEKLKKQQNELRQKLRPDNARTVVVRVQSTGGGKADFRITYLAQNAGWQSAYDLRVTEINQPLGIDSKGEVYNRTGEDWERVKLTLSTGDPSRSNAIPVLYPWWLHFRQPIVAYEKAMRMDAANIRSAAPEMAEADFDGATALSQSEENLTTMEFAIREAFTIPADGKPYTVMLEQKTAPAEYVYIATPRRQPYAFLTATLRDFESFNLSSGKANIYYGQTYIGETWLDSRQAGDSLVLSLGADIGIAVQREKVKDKSARNFFGNKVEETQSWVIRIRNNKTGPINLRVHDQIPLSQDESIEVKSEIGQQGKLNAETGVVTWELKMDAGKQEELRLTYEAKYPKGKELEW